MNEPRWFRDYRSAGTVDQVAKNRARTLLLEAALAQPGTRHRASPSLVGQTRRKNIAWRLALPTALAAAVSAVLITSGPGGPSRPSYHLAAVDTPVFPFTPRRLPAGSGSPQFSLDSQGIVAVYSQTTGLSLPTPSVFIRVSREPAPAGRPDEAVPLEVSPGVAGQLWNRAADKFAALVFEHAGQWIKVGGQGSLADPSVLSNVAASLQDIPQVVPVQISLAPAGWDIQSFKQDNIILDDPQSSDPRRALTVYVTRTFDPATIADGRSVTSTIDLGGRLATTAVHDLTRYLTFALSDGRGVTLTAPADLSANDLSRIARTVVVRRAATP